MTILSWRSNASIDLVSTLDDCKSLLTGAIALVYSPDFCKFAKFVDNRLTFSDNPNLENIFEARIFNSNFELRWLKTSEHSGQAVILGEASLASLSHPWQEPKHLEKLHTSAQEYLLWGEGISSSGVEGWSQLATARIGTVAVPITGLKPHQHVYLTTCEYYQVLDDLYSNVVVAEERLVALKVK
jgi:CRISPR-associated protein (TIGR03984 family)